MKEYYTIGEFSKLFGINIQTLYYYDQIGLLKPTMRNEQNGRRYYAFDQIYQLASIRFMRKLDCSIDQIQEFSANTDYRQSLDSLREHSQKMREHWEELLRIDSIIQRKISFVEERMKNLDTDAVTIRKFPKRRYLPLGGEEQLYYDDSFYHYPTIAFYHPDGKSFGAYLDGPFSDIESLPRTLPVDKICEIPAGKYLCAYHIGPYSRVQESAQKLREEYRHLPLSSEMINFNIIDQFVARNPQKYITEMQIPLVDG